MARRKPEPPPEEPEKKPEPPPKDPFIELVQQTMEAMLADKDATYKDRIAVITNAIKFLMVKHKIEGEGDGGSFFGDDDE